MGATETLARFILDTPAEAIPAPILHEGKRCVINYLAVALYASADPSMQILTGLFEEEGGNPQASLVGVEARTSLQNAALANGYSPGGLRRHTLPHRHPPIGADDSGGLRRRRA